LLVVGGAAAVDVDTPKPKPLPLLPNAASDVAGAPKLRPLPLPISEPNPTPDPLLVLALAGAGAGKPNVNPVVEAPPVAPAALKLKLLAPTLLNVLPVTPSLHPSLTSSSKPGRGVSHAAHLLSLLLFRSMQASHFQESLSTANILPQPVVVVLTFAAPSLSTFVSSSSLSSS